MKAVEQWAPSKFIQSPKRGRWVANRAHVSPGSWYIVDLFAPLYEQAIRAHARGRLLDLGCGMVPFYGMYRDLVTDNVCIDWANSLHANPHIDVVADLNQPFPLPDAAFETVLCSDVLEHIAEPAAFLRETARVLAPGGKLILMVPFLYWVHEQPHDYFRYTEFALRRIAEASGLAVQTLEPYGGMPDVLADLMCKTLGRRRWAITMALAFVATLQIFPSYARWRGRTAVTFPLGYIMVAAKPQAAQEQGA